MNSDYFILYTYLTTIISESVWLLWVEKPKRYVYYVCIIVLVNSCTHPFVLYFLHIKQYNYIIVECAVIVSESILYYLVFGGSKKYWLYMSAIANMVSIVTGIVIRGLL